MSTSHTWIRGGMLWLDTATVAADNRPLHHAIPQALGHNQHMIQAKLAPRHVLNDYLPPDETGTRNTWTATTTGEMIGTAPRIPRLDGVELVCKLRVKIVTVGAAFHWFSTPHLLNGSEPLSDLLERYEDSVYYASTSTSTATWHHLSDVLSPNPGRGQHYYLSLWAHAEATATYQLSGIHAYERRPRPTT